MSVERQSLVVDGAARSYLLAAPSRPPVAGVLLSLHGSTSTPEGQVRLTRMADLADAGAVVAFPAGGVPGARGFRWDHAVDVPFVSTLIDTLIAEYAPPGGKVALSGMSGGARMSCALAWARGDAVSMVGAVGGLRTPPGPPRRPVPVLAFHGTADRINPYAGGGRAYWGESVPDAAARWAAANGLPPEPTITKVGDDVTRTTYGTEDDPRGVTLFTFAGAGHTWPGHKLPLVLRLLLGRTSTTMDATDAIWRTALRTAANP